ncbi:MAG: WG repeat-containing protein [Clostridia bacterium]|nr:WG repeat-containing protein [Clostridia bacterium]
MKKIYALLCLFFCLCMPVAAQETYSLVYPFKDGTARVVTDLKWGLVDQNLKTVLAPKWDYLGEVSEGLRTMRQGTLFGFTDEKGKQVISPTFSHAEPFSQELSAVKNEEGLWGYINTKGKTVIPFSFEDAHSFSDGLALVKYEGAYGYINKDGDMTITPTYEEAYPFSEGLACVRQGDKYGYIDTEGTMVIPAQFELAFDFTEGAAVVKSGKYGLIDTAGAFLIKPSWSQLAPDITNGLMKAMKNGRWGIIDTQGKAKTTFVYNHIGDFAQGLCPVATDEGWGYLDESFSLALPFVWEQASAFSEGFAAVSKDGLWGYIDKSGNPKTDFCYTSCGQVVGDLAPLCDADGNYQFVATKDFCVSKDEPAESDEPTEPDTLLLQIGNTLMQKGKDEIPLDVAPAIYDGHTLLPIRAVVEAIDGTVEWKEAEKKVTLQRGGHLVILYIDETAAFVDGRITILPIAPMIRDGRTLIPLRFATESLECIVDWKPETQEIAIQYEMQ